jgi:hypothetical protein
MVAFGIFLGFCMDASLLVFTPGRVRVDDPAVPPSPSFKVSIIDQAIHPYKGVSHLNAIGSVLFLPFLGNALDPVKFMVTIPAGCYIE